MKYKRIQERLFGVQMLQFGDGAERRATIWLFAECFIGGPVLEHDQKHAEFGKMDNLASYCTFMSAVLYLKFTAIRAAICE